MSQINIDSLFSLNGKVVLVTGGSRGIGRMIAEGYLRSGARVYISARKREAYDRATEELSRFGDCVSLPADVSTSDGRAALVEAIGRSEESLDILINNAGQLGGGVQRVSRSGFSEGHRPQPDSGLLPDPKPDPHARAGWPGR